MNERELKIAKAILTALNQCDGQMIETIIHAEVNLLLAEHVPLVEINAVIRECDRQGWLVGVKPKFGRMIKWSINDAGRGALLEMR